MALEKIGPDGDVIKIDHQTGKPILNPENQHILDLVKGITELEDNIIKTAEKIKLYQEQLEQFNRLAVGLNKKLDSRRASINTDVRLITLKKSKVVNGLSHLVFNRQKGTPDLRNNLKEQMLDLKNEIGAILEEDKRKVKNIEDIEKQIKKINGEVKKLNPMMESEVNKLKILEKKLKDNKNELKILKITDKVLDMYRFKTKKDRLLRNTLLNKIASSQATAAAEAAEGETALAGGKRRKRKSSKKIRKHKGINQSTGRLKKGYKYSGRKLKSGLSQIIKV